MYRKIVSMCHKGKYMRMNCIFIGVLLFMGGSMARKSNAGLMASSFAKRAIVPMEGNQQIYCDFLKEESIPIVLGVGPAGCGKTMFACQSAVGALMGGSVDKIVMTRPLVSVDEELGFLPGSIENKMGPWVRPIFDILSEFYTAGEIRKMVDDGVLEISPLAYMRGRTFKRAFIVADEMQNSSPNQMFMMLTRIGEGSKMVITGDLQQSDFDHGAGGLNTGRTNGLADLYKRLRGKTVEGIRLVEFGTGDVKRSDVVASVLALYENKKTNGSQDAALIPIKDYVL